MAKNQTKTPWFVNERIENRGKINKIRSINDRQKNLCPSAAKFTLESAAYDTRGRCPANPDHSSDAAQRKSRVRRESDALVQWADSQGFLKKGYPRLLLKPQARGGEHFVSLHSKSKRFFKATRPEAQLGFGIALGDYIRGAAPAEYLDRLALHNQIFADNIQLECVAQLSNRQISIITSQPAITGRPALDEEIDAMMKLKKTARFGPGIFYDARQGLLLYDLLPRNVLVDQNNILQVIDPVIQRVEPDFAEFIRANPNLVERP